MFSALRHTLLASSLLFGPLALLADEVPTAYLEASAAADKGNSARAVELATEAINKDPTFARAYYLRGREYFRLGKIRESVRDFDQYVKLVPAVESRQWERGIALYYAGEFQRGADQFKLYQTYHSNDVENSTWRYLCVAKVEGVEKARATILPIENDRRGSPMMEIYDLYRGKLKPQDVLDSCENGEPSKEVLDGRLFYARLYLGLYYEANGEKELAEKYIFMAADKHKTTQTVNRYMYDVARIHANLLRSRKPASKQSAE